MKSDSGILLTGSKTGILLLHDVGGSAAELRQHANAVARSGYTVSCPQLVGLGEVGAGRGSAGMLVSEAEQALTRLKSRCDNVAVVGIAYGGMLALQLARHNPTAIQAIVLVEPRTWLPSLQFAPTWAPFSKVKQTWLANVVTMADRLRARKAVPAAKADNKAKHAGRHDNRDPDALRNMARLLDSVHAGLPSIKQPVLLMHGQTSARNGLSGAFLLQRRLGGRVESIMMDEQPQGAAKPDRNLEGIAERCTQFVATVLDEIETRRGNELRRQQVAAGRNSAA